MDLKKMTEVWADYVFDDRLSPELRAPIAQSWRKCKAARVNSAEGEGRHIDERVLESVREENRLFLSASRTVMDQVYRLIRPYHNLVALTDSTGYLLEMLGDEDISPKSDDLRFQPGALWSDLAVGTNAISVALDYDIPFCMAGPEHYCLSHHSWACAAAPIHGPSGEIIGCIDISGALDHFYEGAAELVAVAAAGIETQIRDNYYASMMESVLSGSRDAIIMIDEAFRVLWMNQAARELLEAEPEELNEQRLTAMLPELNWAEEFRGEAPHHLTDNLGLHLQGDTKYCSCTVFPLSRYGVRSLGITLRLQKDLVSVANKLIGNRAIYTFSDFHTCDDAMRKTLAMAAKFARYDGNILIQGESGTGKEVLAQAIHNAGRNADGPFVSVNCASIPRDLFEMELFGYEADAFPGKVTEGKPGRFELAKHGTLFLDEVSSMPLEYQQKLLRAVETHSIRRLGSNQEIPLDIRIIASTNQDLSELVRTGDFRQELYYRLNVLKLDISPLRERRADIGYCAEQFLRRFNDLSFTDQKTMTPEFLEGLAAYDWPGNNRQLQNALARAFYSETGSLLTARSLAYAIEQPSREPAETRPELDQDSGAGAIVAALTLCGGDVGAAAERLGLSRATLYRRLKRYNIDPKVIKRQRAGL